jgi:hypothetical protein
MKTADQLLLYFLRYEKKNEKIQTDRLQRDTLGANFSKMAEKSHLSLYFQY